VTAIPIIYFALKAAGVGGIVSSDETSCGQFMLSRPIASGFLTGLVLGKPVLGSVVGAFFELLYLDLLPVGGSRFPSAGLAAVTAVSVCIYLGFESFRDAVWFIPFLFLLSALSAGAGGWLVVKVRRTNTRLFGIAEAAVSQGKFLRMGYVHLAGILLSFSRGFVTVFLFFCLTVTSYVIIERAHVSVGPAPTLLVIPFAALGSASALRSYVTKKRVLHVLFGGFVTLLIIYLS
jgi:mannose/fructose/N-acetylgalactosamine-specific phosphotransferase system component IIC